MISTEQKKEVKGEEAEAGEIVTEKAGTGSAPEKKRKGNLGKSIFQGACLVYYLVGVIEILLISRLSFKILEANPESGFVSFTYSVTNILLFPFSGIFQKVLLDPATIIAIFIYGIIGWSIFKLAGMLLMGKK